MVVINHIIKLKKVQNLGLLYGVIGWPLLLLYLYFESWNFKSTLNFMTSIYYPISYVLVIIFILEFLPKYQQSIYRKDIEKSNVQMST